MIGKLCGVECCEATFATAAEAQAHEDKHSRALALVEMIDAMVDELYELVAPTNDEIIEAREASALSEEN
jgi:hypothetical protein